MTFIKPNKKSSMLTAILVVLSIAVSAGVFGMVVLYNMTVNVSHNITAARAELDAIGASSTDMSNQIIATLGGSELTELVTADGLVTDAKPEYFQVNQEWPIASQF